VAFGVTFGAGATGLTGGATVLGGLAGGATDFGVDGGFTGFRMIGAGGVTVFGGLTGGFTIGAGFVGVFGGLTGGFTMGAGLVGVFVAGGFTLGVGVSIPAFGIVGVFGVTGVVSNVPVFGGFTGGRPVPVAGVGSTLPRAVAFGDGGETGPLFGLTRLAVFGSPDFGVRPLFGVFGPDTPSCVALRGDVSLEPAPPAFGLASSASVLARRSPAARTLRADSSSDWRSAAETVCRFRRPPRPASFNEVSIVTLFKFVLLLLIVVLLFVMLLITVFC